MLVYRDRSESADPTQRLGALAREIGRVRTLAPGLERHCALVRAIIEAGQLLQGVADAAGETDVLTRLVQRIAECVLRSWDSGFGQIGELPGVPDIERLPDRVELRTPEGFAFYAVYPEAFADAARKLRLSAPPRVIGIRSIGTTLGAMVAAALDAPLVTVRPFGDPFERQVELPPDVIDDNSHYVIVDEGPGQSGSSFGAVADWLEARGVPLERIAFVPSHPAPPGPRSSERQRERWGRAQKVAGDLGERLPHLLAQWARVDELTEISAGAWRTHIYRNESDWPAVNPAWEARKFLACVSGEWLLLKFAGLGAIGERKFMMARALHSAGFTPEPLGLVHGFIVERWCEGARPLERSDTPVDQIARYLAARAQLFPAKPGSGASMQQLYEMCVRNLSLGLGPDAAEAMKSWRPRLAELERKARRVRTDNRLDRHEWLRLPGGGLVKTDALDHHCGHDLIGCQDVAWDVAGAISDFQFDDAQAASLIRSVECHSGSEVDGDLLEYCRLAYLAFRLGHATLAAEMCASNAAESARLNARAQRYVTELQELLHESTSAATRLESLIG